jgi:hypothetical protein
MKDNAVNGPSNQDEFLPHEMRKLLQLKISYFQKTEWYVNEKQYRVYVTCCKVLRKLAEDNNGVVVEDYITHQNGENDLFNHNIKRGDCIIQFPCLCLDELPMEMLKKVMECCDNFSIYPADSNNVRMSMTVPDVYIDMGIKIDE